MKAKTLALAALVACVCAAGCEPKVKSKLTGRDVPLTQAWEEQPAYEAKVQAEQERDAARSEQAARELQAQREADHSKVIRSQEREASKLSRDAAAEAARIARERDEAIERLRDQLRDQLESKDDAAAETVRKLDAEWRARIDEVQSGFQARTEERAAAVDSSRVELKQVEADWARRAGVWQGALKLAEAPVRAFLGEPGVAALGSIGSIAALFGVGYGVKKRNDSAKSDRERDAIAAANDQLEVKKIQLEQQAAVLAGTVQKVVDGIEALKDRPDFVWNDSIKEAMAGWVKGSAGDVVEAARENRDVLATAASV